MTNVTILTDDNGVKREYLEIERKANVGERVLIVSPCSTGGMYTKGDVLTVDRYGHIGLPITNVGVTVFKEEYLVLEPTDIIHVDGVRYREEKREAKAGERILIVAVDDATGWYTNGSVLTVKEIPGMFSCVRIKEYDWLVYHREYVVITPVDEPIPNNITVNLTVNVASSSPTEILKAIIDSVQAELAKTEAPINTGIDTTAVGRALQKMRDNAVERAKEDVWVLRADTSNVRNPALRRRGDIYIKNRLGLTADFIVNREKRTVVCLLRGGVTPERIYARGIAKCAPDDCFNVHIGKAIALRRALGLDVPTDYLNAPQPTEPRVGDVVKSTRAFGRNPEGRVLQVGGGTYICASEGLTFFTADGEHVWRFKSNVKIIDDSRDQETEVTGVA